MNVLIVHQNFPGQFPHIADALLARGDKVAAIGGDTAKGRPGVDLRRWKIGRGTTPNILPAAIRAEADLIRGEAAAMTALQLKRDGFTPDVIIGHPGWGETVHLKEVWPTARLILLGEMFYRSHGTDAGFDPEFSQPSFAEDMRINAKNAVQALAYSLADRIICPTKFQASTFPAALQPLIRVQHEGIDLSKARRREGARVKLPGGRVLDGSKPVVTFVNRTLEPLRGFHIFMRALPAFLDAVPEAEVVIIGREGTNGYGTTAPGGTTWKTLLLKELEGQLDMSRVHFLGTVPHTEMIDAFSISWAHVYYTYPFVLSWSLVEAMACECLILGSETAPLHDAIQNQVEGLLLPFFNISALAAALIQAVEHRLSYTDMRSTARIRAFDEFSQCQGVTRWLAEI